MENLRVRKTEGLEKMNSSLSLDGAWKIRWCDDDHGRPEQFVGAEADETLFYDATVPGEVHVDLMRAGLIGDVDVGVNAQNARWIEEEVWVYRRQFHAPRQAATAKTSWLVFDGLDLNAIVYLNGEEVGRHDNAYIPCRIKVTGKLREGTNTVAVWLESGLFAASDKPGTCYEWWSINHKLHKRAWLRKPQYQFEWDWNPRLINVGIWRPVRLEWADAARLDTVTVYPELSEDHSRAKIHCRLFAENVTGDDLPATVRMACPETGASVEQDVTLPAGDSRHDLAVDVADPKLWWPRPHGDQPLYTVEAELVVSGETVGALKRRTGIRSVKINQDPHPEEGRYFIIEINGRPIFMKGGNWVPPDMIYQRIDADRCRKLVELAVEANCNALRVWGGGLFADHAMLDACDELGVMVWHDFLYACAKYPLDDVEFMHNIEAEAVFAIRDLSPHPSLVLWCGNNEIDEAFYNWRNQKKNPYPHYAIFHHILPVLMKDEDPSRPYWPGSPYSPDHENPQSKICGDQHPWEVSIWSDAENIWAYRKDVSRCANEGGVLGASTPATIRQFLPDDERRLHSRSWVFHDNAVNFRTSPGLCYEMVENWVGMKPEEMDFDDYLFYSSLMHAEGLKEYIDNYRRRMYSSSAAIFWMYNDSWPVSHGWTIVDYYLRRKLSYYPVRRAFQPITVVPAVEGEHVLIVGVNETTADWQGTLRYGLANLSGSLPMDENQAATIPANSAAQLARIPMAQWRETGTKKSVAFALLSDGGQVIAQNRIFVEKFMDLDWAAAEISVTRDGDHAVFSSPTFVWGVCIDLDGESALPDNAFDLLPGIEYRIPWPADQPLPEIVRTGNLK